MMIDVRSEVRFVGCSARDRGRIRPAHTLANSPGRTTEGSRIAVHRTGQDFAANDAAQPTYTATPQRAPAGPSCSDDAARPCGSSTALRGARARRRRPAPANSASRRRSSRSHAPQRRRRAQRRDDAALDGARQRRSTAPSARLPRVVTAPRRRAAARAAKPRRPATPPKVSPRRRRRRARRRGPAPSSGPRSSRPRAGTPRRTLASRRAPRPWIGAKLASATVVVEQADVSLASGAEALLARGAALKPRRRRRAPHHVLLLRRRALLRPGLLPGLPLLRRHRLRGVLRDGREGGRSR